MRRFLPFLALVSLSCSPTSRPDFDIHLVNPTNGLTPFGDCTGTVRVDVLQAGNAVLTSNGSVSAGTLSDISVEIPSYGLITQIQVRVNCLSGTPTGQLIGSTPAFIPVGYGFVNIAIGPTSTCERLALPILATPRTGTHLVALHANVVVIGGVDEGAGPSPQLQAIDPISLTHADAPELLTSLTVPAGLGGASVLDPTSTTTFQLVIVSDQLTTIYDATPGATTTEIVIDPQHPGIGSESGVVGTPGNGVVILGGYDGGPVTGFTIVATDGTSKIGDMQIPRRRPTGVQLGPTHLLVIGGQAAGQPLFEIIDMATATADLTAPFGPTEARYAPIAFTDVSRSRVWVGLGTDAIEGGNIQTTSWLLSSCTPDCMWEASTPFPDARTDVAIVDHHVGVMSDESIDSYEGLVLGGTGADGMASTLVNRVAIPETGPVVIEALGALDPVIPRSATAAAEVGGGVVLVAGGSDDHGAPLDTIEICFPPALAPISVIN